MTTHGYAVCNSSGNPVPESFARSSADAAKRSFLTHQLTLHVSGPAKTWHEWMTVDGYTVRAAKIEVEDASPQKTT